MEMPVKPERPSIFTTPVKFLTKEDIASISRIRTEHEIALNEYYKELDAYYKYLESENVGCREASSMV